MVLARPSKILSGWSYESKPKPLRSSRTAGEFCETEVTLLYINKISSIRITAKNPHLFSIQAPETEDETAGSDYQEFSKLLLNGQRVANDTKKSYVFMWRGYRACISSQLPKLSSIEITRRFKLAMDFINKTEEVNTYFHKQN